MTTNAEKVEEFHDKFYLTRRKCGYPAWNESLLRVRLIIEELGGLTEALQLQKYPEVAKELADLLYVVYGVAMAMGIPIDTIFDAVHQANMTKAMQYDGGGKLMKGECYEPPPIEKILNEFIRANQEWGDNDGSS